MGQYMLKRQFSEGSHHVFQIAIPQELGQHIHIPNIESSLSNTGAPICTTDDSTADSATMVGCTARDPSMHTGSQPGIDSGMTAASHNQSGTKGNTAAGTGSSPTITTVWDVAKQLLRYASEYFSSGGCCSTEDACEASIQVQICSPLNQTTRQILADQDVHASPFTFTSTDDLHVTHSDSSSASSSDSSSSSSSDSNANNKQESNLLQVCPQSNSETASDPKRKGTDSSSTAQAQGKTEAPSEEPQADLAPLLPVDTITLAKRQKDSLGQDGQQAKEQEEAGKHAADLSVLLPPDTTKLAGRQEDSPGQDGQQAKEEEEAGKQWADLSLLLTPGTTELVDRLLRESCGEGWLLQPKVVDMTRLEYRVYLLGGAAAVSLLAATHAPDISICVLFIFAFYKKGGCRSSPRLHWLDPLAVAP